MGWDNRIVPAGCAHIVGIGHYYGIESVGEMILVQASFPFSVAAAGVVQAEDLEVFSIPSLSHIDENGVVKEEDKLEGHVLSNSSNTGAVELNGQTSVSGDVSTPGTVVGPGRDNIEGEILEDADPLTIPAVKATDFDPLGKDYTNESWTTAETLVAGRNRHIGDLTIGDTEFYDGLLYVVGNVTVQGTLHGKGALVATGDIHVTTGQMDIANDVTALVAGGNVIVDGLGPNSSLFKGIVFAEGSIEFKRTTVVGASISADSSGSVLMDEVKAVNAPEVNAVLIEKDVTLSEATKAGRNLQASGDSSVGVLMNGTFTEFTTANEPALKILAADVAANNTPHQFIIREQSGDTIVEPPLERFKREVRAPYGRWDAYLTEHRNNEIVRIDVFDLNLNRALSITDKLVVKFRSVESYKR